MKKSAFDPSKRLDIYLRIGRVNTRSFLFLTESGAPVDLSSEGLTLFVKNNAGSIPNQISLSVNDGLSITDNILTIIVASSSTVSLSQGEYYWELVNGAHNQTWLNGKLFLTNGEFDGVDSDDGEIIIGSEDPIQVILNPSIGGGSGGGGVQSIVAGFGIGVDSTDPENPIVRAFPVNEVGSGSVFTSGSTISLDFGDAYISFFSGQSSISSANTVTLSGDVVASMFVFFIQISNVAGTLTFPSNFTALSSETRWNNTTKRFTASATGKYKITGTYDVSGAQWRLEFSTSFL